MVCLYDHDKIRYVTMVLYDIIITLGVGVMQVGMSPWCIITLVLYDIMKPLEGTTNLPCVQGLAMFSHLAGVLLDGTKVTHVLL